MTRELFQEAINKKFGVEHFARWDDNTNDSIFMLKYGEYNNVYRIFAYFDRNEILVQCCGCAWYYDGEERYDEAIDFNGGQVKLMSIDTVDDWVDTIERVLKMQNLVDGAVTVYEYTPDEYRSMVYDTLPDENARKIYYIWDDKCPYIGVELNNGEYWVYGAHNDHRVESVEEIIDVLYTIW